MKPIVRFTTYPHMSRRELKQEMWDACVRGDLEQLVHVLENPDLQERPNIYDDKGEGVWVAYFFKHMHIVNYFIHTAGMELTPELKDVCQRHHALHNEVNPEGLYQLFERHKLHTSLQAMPERLERPTVQAKI